MTEDELNLCRTYLTNCRLVKADIDDNVSLASIQYYRLKQVDKDGAATYSKTIAIKTNSEQSLNILSVTNPFSSRINIAFNKPLNSVVRISLLDITGKAIQTIQKTSAS